VIGLVQFDQR